MNNLAIHLILDNIRSAHNVGAILRTSDAAGAAGISVCGTTPYPQLNPDNRPPHIAASNARAIAKTALGAELTLPIQHFPDTLSAIHEAKLLGFKIIVLEQSERSLNLYHYRAVEPLALVVGNEVNGVDQAVLDAADTILELPMIGRKESLNVAVSAGIALYHLRFGLPS